MRLDIRAGKYERGNRHVIHFSQPADSLDRREAPRKLWDRLNRIHLPVCTAPPQHADSHAIMTITQSSGKLTAELRVLDHDAQSSQDLLLSPALWQQVTSSSAKGVSSAANSKRISISVSPADGRPFRTSLLPALSFFAVQEASAHSIDDPSALFIRATPDVTKRLRSTGSARRGDSPQYLIVRPHVLLSASSVYLAASSAGAYELAQDRQADILKQLDGQILQQGSLLRLDLSSALLPLRVIMVEPLLQATFSAQDTQVLLTVTNDVEEARDGDLSVSSIMTDASASVDEAAEDDAEEHGAAGEEEDDLVIDESFLAQSVLDDFSQLDISVEPVLPTALNARSATKSFHKVRNCILNELQDGVLLNEAIAGWRKQHDQGAQPPHQAAESLDEAIVALASERDLASMGAFNGDWAVANVANGPAPRIIRIMSSSRIATSRSCGMPSVWMSPILAQNIFADQMFSSSSSRVVSVRVLGSRPPETQQQVSALARSCPVPLPFADSLTIARVAGPLTIDRAYQNLFLDALRTHFEDRRRICRSGDVIAVAIEATKARFVKREVEQDGPKDAALDDIHELKLPSAALGPVKTAVVYFKISDIKPELVAPVQMSSALYNDEALRTLAMQAQAGTLGCVVDPDVTKMVQTGVEQCRVVDCDRWLDVVSETPSIATRQQSPLTSKASPYATVRSLLSATLQENAGRFGLHLSVLLKGARGSGKKTLARWVARSAGVQLVEIDCFDLISDTDARTEGVLRARFAQASECAPCILLLRNIEALARKSQALETGQEPPLATALQSCFDELWKLSSDASAETKPMPVAVFGTTSDPDKCPTGVLGCFKHEISLGAPNEAERREILEIALTDAILSPDVDVKNLATQTAALVAADLVDLVSRARYASVARVRAAMSNLALSDRDLVLAGLALTGSDFDQALAKARSSYSESIGAPKIPNVTWDDVGGLASVKSEILDTIQLPLEHPELFSDGLKKRSGILLYGPPGTGKTLLAKAVATSCSLNFFSVKGPELLNMYIGESEANVRRVFQRARDAKPCVIFFDELDSVAPKRGNQGDSGGVMDRIVSQLLAELDGMAGSAEGTDVFVIGATNRPDLLDPALLRPGRFDRMLYLSVSETHAAQLNILQALTRKFKLDEDLGDLSCIANQCPFNLTGADFYALCSDSMLKAMTRKASEVDQRIADINATPGPKGHPSPLTAQYYLAEMAQPEEIEVKVNRQDFELALKELTPSVSEQEMQHYREVQAKFSAPKEDTSQAPQQQVPIANGGSTMQERARKAIEELGYSIPEENPVSPQHLNGNGPRITPAQGKADTSGKGKGKAKAVDAEAISSSKSKGKARE